MAATIVAVQHNVIWEDKPATIAAVEALLAPLSIARGSLVALPEMFASGFSMNVSAVAEDDRGPAHCFLSELARRYACTVLGGVSTLGCGPLGGNEAIAYGPDGREIARYRKQHLFSYAGEHKHYTAGRQCITFDWQGFIVCPLICYDLRFPEVFRAALRTGANLFAVIANWPAPRTSHWATLLSARAIENQAYVAGVNRCGSDPHNEYTGASMIVGPQGDLLAAAGPEQCVLEAELDAAALRQYRKRFPALQDRRLPRRG